MSPEQYDANVKTKKSGTEFVEFAIKLPGKDDANSTVYLPIDAKFPKDVYEQYYDAFEAGDTALMESSGKQLETTIKKMAKDIHDKYVDPPFTTDFAIMFLPFESIYAEVIRRTSNYPWCYIEQSSDGVPHAGYSKAYRRSVDSFGSS